MLGEGKDIYQRCERYTNLCCQFPLWLAFPPCRPHRKAIFSKDTGSLSTIADIHIMVDSDDSRFKEGIPDGC